MSLLESCGADAICLKELQLERHLCRGGVRMTVVAAEAAKGEGEEREKDFDRLPRRPTSSTSNPVGSDRCKLGPLLRYKS